MAIGVIGTVAKTVAKGLAAAKPAIDAAAEMHKKTTSTFDPKGSAGEVKEGDPFKPHTTHLASASKNKPSSPNDLT